MTGTKPVGHHHGGVRELATDAGASQVGRHHDRAQQHHIAVHLQARGGHDLAVHLADEEIPARFDVDDSDRLEIVVRAEVEVRVAFGLGGRALATARAGPIYAVPG